MIANGIQGIVQDLGYGRWDRRGMYKHRKVHEGNTKEKEKRDLGKIGKSSTTSASHDPRVVVAQFKIA